MTTRREFLAATAAAALAGRARFAAAAPAPLPELVLYGPPAGPSIIAAQAVESGALAAVAERASFRVWKTPDEMRAGFASGKWAASIVPTYAAANLYNRGLPVRLVNVMTEGLLYVVATDPAVTSLAALRGRTLVLPFKNDMPDHVLHKLAATAGVTLGGDIAVEYAGTPTEAMQLLLAGRSDAALVPEPAATAAVVRGMRAGKKVHRAIDVQQAWAESFGGLAAIPQAGLAVSQAFATGAGERLAALHAALAEAAAWVNANPASAARVAVAYLDLPAPVLERSIPFSNLRVSAATARKPALGALFELLAERNPAILGGKLPDTGFYAL
ncbi:MAG: ABC transporter substrate-binding protein [Burkholderiales bacterium]|nr:ABC transporter substrate-binding protein [Burkholderiales bacterium]